MDLIQWKQENWLSIDEDLKSHIITLLTLLFDTHFTLLIPDEANQDEDDISDISDETHQENEAIVVQDFRSSEKLAEFSSPLRVESEGMQFVVTTRHIGYNLNDASISWDINLEKIVFNVTRKY